MIAVLRCSKLIDIWLYLPMTERRSLTNRQNFRKNCVEECIFILYSIAFWIPIQQKLTPPELLFVGWISFLFESKSKSSYSSFGFPCSVVSYSNTQRYFSLPGGHGNCSLGNVVVVAGDAVSPVMSYYLTLSPYRLVRREIWAIEMCRRRLTKIGWLFAGALSFSVFVAV